MNASRLRIIYTKLLPPRLGADVIVRGRLLGRMERVPDCTMTLITAPAGTGKTTLAAQWAAGAPLPVAWLSLDAADSSLTAFVSYLAAALRKVFPAALPSVEAFVQTAAQPPTDYVADQIVNDLAELPGDFALVLDDYHAIHDPAVHALLGRVLDFAPPHLHLVLATRVEPPLPLARLRAAGHLLELRLRDLRFTGDEVGVFLQSAARRQLPDDVIHSLEARTEGWGVGLRMAALSLAAGGDAHALLDRLEEGQEHLFVYLADEVLAKQPEAMQSFLLGTSLLERMCAPLCDELLDALAPPARMPARAALDALQRANLFVTPADSQLSGGPVTWYRYHALFREFLAARLREHADAATLCAMHARASRWFAAEGFVEEALHHALQAGDLDAFDAVIGGALIDLLNSEDRQRLDRWLALAPPGAQRGRTSLTLARCWQHHWRAQMEAIAPLLAAQFPGWRLESSLPGAPPELAGQVDLLQAVVAFEQRDAGRTIRLSERALATLPAAFPFARGMAFVYLSKGMQFAGREDEYCALVEAALAQAAEDHTIFPVRLEISLTLLFTYAGRWPEALVSATRLYERACRDGFRLGVNWGHYGIALAHYESGQTEAALQHFTSIARSPYTGHMIAVMHSLLCLAQIYQAQGDPERADRCLDDAERMALQSGPAYMARDVQVARAGLALARGEVLRAYQLSAPVRELTLPPEQLLTNLSSRAALVRILLAYNARDSLHQAQQLADRLLAAAQRLHFGAYEVELLVAQAEVRHALGDETGALAALERALALAEPHGSTRVFLQAGALIPDLLRRVAARGAAVRYVHHLLALIAAHQPAAQARGAGAPLAEPLTNRELDVLELVAKRWSNKEVAETLVISPMTVQRHLTNIFQKLAAENRRDAVVKARALGLLG